MYDVILMLSYSMITIVPVLPVLVVRADLRSMKDCGGMMEGLAVSHPARQC